MAQPDIDVDSISIWEYSKPCETVVIKCDNPATYAVWVDHHVQGCDYSGFRCDEHRQFLEQEVQKHIDATNAGFTTVCLACGTRMDGGNLSDHFRYVRL